MLDYIPVVSTLVEVGSQAYQFFSKAWNFLTTPLDPAFSTGIVQYLSSFLGGAAVVPKTPLELCLSGITFIIVVKLLRLIWDALPWL